MARSSRAASKSAPSPGLDVFEDALGHRFADRALLARALTHASAAGQPGAPEGDNQRLEFLGDRVLGLLTSEALLAAHPDATEGGLAPRLNALVRKETCAEVAHEIGLGPHLRLARSEAMTGGRRKTALLGDAMEAVIAAVYLDGGLEAARAMFDRHWRARLEAQEEAPIDAKTALQEWAQARGWAPPRYALAARSGPDHAPVFTVAAELSPPDAAAARAEGRGGSKRAAEQAAAAALHARMIDGSAA